MRGVYLVVDTFLLIKAAVHEQGIKPYENCCFLTRGGRKIKCHTDCCMAFCVLIIKRTVVTVKIVR